MQARSKKYSAIYDLMDTEKLDLPGVSLSSFPPHALLAPPFATGRVSNLLRCPVATEKVAVEQEAAVGNESVVGERTPPCSSAWRAAMLCVSVCECV